MSKESKSNHKNNKSLKGEKVLLSPLSKTDFKLIKKWYKNPIISQYVFPDKNLNIFLKVFIKLIKPNIISKLYKYYSKNGYSFIINYNKKSIGVIVCWLIDKENKTYRVPIVIGIQKFWGKGLGKDTIQTVKKFIFDDLSGETIIAGDVSKENSRSINMFQSCGFKKLSKPLADFYRNLSKPKKYRNNSFKDEKIETVSFIIER